MNFESCTSYFEAGLVIGIGFMGLLWGVFNFGKYQKEQSKCVKTRKGVKE